MKHTNCNTCIHSDICVLKDTKTYCISYIDMTKFKYKRPQSAILTTLKRCLYYLAYVITFSLTVLGAVFVVILFTVTYVR